MDPISPIHRDLTLLAMQSDAPIAGAEGGAASPSTTGQPADGPGTTGAPGTPAGPAGGAGGAASPFGGAFIWVILLMFVVMMVLTGMSGRRERKRQQQLVESLKKHDRVRTRAGIIGTIVELRNDEMVLEVDKASGTRVRFVRSAVEQVLDGRTTSSVTPADDATEPAPQS